jgi:hypothetical protein
LQETSIYSETEATGSEWHYKLVKVWLKECIEIHPVCARKTIQELPTKVLDVGTLQDDVMKLYIPQVSKMGVYATLSDCWGKMHLLMLDTGAEASLKAGIELRGFSTPFAMPSRLLAP